MPFISLKQVGGKLLLPQILQGVNASDQGCPVEAEARPPEPPTEIPMCPPATQRGAGWETVHNLAFKGAKDPKAGFSRKGKRGQEMVPELQTPAQCLMGTTSN